MYVCIYQLLKPEAPTFTRSSTDFSRNPSDSRIANLGVFGHLRGSMIGLARPSIIEASPEEGTYSHADHDPETSEHPQGCKCLGFRGLGTV